MGTQTVCKSNQCTPAMLQNEKLAVDEFLGKVAAASRKVATYLALDLTSLLLVACKPVSLLISSETAHHKLTPEMCRAWLMFACSDRPCVILASCGDVKYWR